MRQPVACEGTTAEYRLEVRIEGALVADRVVRGGGLRRDRRLYVFEEIVLPPGEAAVDVTFDRVDGSEAGVTVAAARDRERAQLDPGTTRRGPAASVARAAHSTSRHARWCSSPTIRIDRS